MTTRAVFVCGAHTDVGKTHVACALLEAARARGWRAAALKPVVSGFDPDEPLQSDPGRLIAALGLEMGPATLDAMSPYRFRAALSPPMAARREGARLELAALIACSKLWLERTDVEFALVEGVGGVMSPIAEGAVCLDLMRALALPAIAVGGSYLGGISHILTAVATAEAQGVRVSAIVISQSADPAAPDFAETVADVRSFAGATPVFAAPRDVIAGWPDEILDGV
jgi:dethiobiotin synthetase